MAGLWSHWGYGVTGVLGTLGLLGCRVIGVLRLLESWVTEVVGSVVTEFLIHWCVVTGFWNHCLRVTGFLGIYGVDSLGMWGH